MMSSHLVRLIEKFLYIRFSKFAVKAGYTALVSLLFLLSLFFPYTQATTRAPANYLKHDMLYYGTISSPSSVQAFCFTVPDYYFSAIAIKPLSGQNLDLELYTDFDPNTNSFSGWLNTSDRGAGLVDLIVIDAVSYYVNPTLYANVSYVSGSFPNNYMIEVDGWSCENSSHEDYQNYKYKDYTNTTYSKKMHSGEIIDTCEFYLSKGVTYNISLPITPPGASYKTYIFPTFGELSDPNGYGASGDQNSPMFFTPRWSGWHCVVIVNENNVAGDYTLLVKTANVNFLENNLSVQKKFSNDEYKDPALFEYNAPAYSFTAVGFKPDISESLQLDLYSDVALQNLQASSYEPTGKFSLAIVDRTSASYDEKQYAILTDWIEHGKNYRIEADSARTLQTNITYYTYWNQTNLFDVYQIYMHAGLEYNISIPSEPSTAKYSTYLFSSSGSLASNLSHGTDDIPILYTPEHSGYYAIVVVQDYAVTGSYSILASIPAFDIVSSNTSFTNMPGGLNITTLSITPTYGFSSPIFLTATGAPPGVDITFSSNPASVPSSVTAYFSISPQATLGTYNITITGASGGISKSINITLMITNFSLQIIPTIQTVIPGGSTSYTINVLGDGPAVSLSYSFSPNGPYGTFSPNPVVPGSSSTFTVNTPGTLTAGSYYFTVTATRSWMVKTVNGQLDVTTDFMISANPYSLSISPGSSDGSTIFVSGTGGAVSLSASCPEPTITASIGSPSVIPGSSTTITISVGASTPQGTYLVNIVGTRGAITHETHIEVKVMPDFQISVEPDSCEINPGGNAQFTVSVSGAGDAVVLSATSIQPTLSFSFNPGIVDIGSESVLTVSSTSGTPIGSYEVTIKAERNGQIRTKVVSVTVVSISDFSISASPEIRSISAGMQATYSVSVTGIGSFSSVVLLSASGTSLPISFNPLSIYPGTTSTMTVQTSPTTPPGTSTITITGTGGGKTHSTIVQLAVSAQTPLTAQIDSITPSPAIQGETVTLTGHAEGGSGTYIDYCWKSSIDGYLGNSPTLTLNTLSLGNHTIFFSVKDNSGSGTWSDEVTANLDVRLSPNGPTVRVNTPNGGETWGGTNEITWTARPHVTGSTILISLYYTSDGVLWNLISANEQNDGRFTLDTTKYPNGNTYKIRVVASENGIIGMDESDAVFSILNTQSNNPPTASLAFPENNTIVTTTSTLLSWSGSDPDGDTLTYDVYLDTLDASKLVARGISSPIYYATGLISGVTYNWRVVPYDGKTYGSCISGTHRFSVNTKIMNSPPSLTQWFPAENTLSAEEGSQINFSIVGADSDGDGLSHQWYVNGILVYGKSNSPGSNYVFVTNSTSAGFYNVSAYIFDGKGNYVYRTWSVTITDKNNKPIPIITTPSSGAQFEYGEEIFFDGSQSYDPDGDQVYLTWRLGDLELGSGTTLRISTLQPGEKTITLLARDNKGGSATATVTILIKDKPKAEISLLGIESSGEKKVNSENIISVRVSNGAPYDSAPFALRMSVNGENYEDKQMSLHKNESAKIDFYWAPEKDGEYVIIVEINPSSDITIKNGRVQIKIIIQPETKDFTFLWILVIIILLGIVIAGAIIIRRRAERERETLYGPYALPNRLPSNNLPQKEPTLKEHYYSPQKDDTQPLVSQPLVESMKFGEHERETPIFAKEFANSNISSDINKESMITSPSENIPGNISGKEYPPETTKSMPTPVLKPKSVSSSRKYITKMPANYSKEGPSALREETQNLNLQSKEQTKERELIQAQNLNVVQPSQNMPIESIKTEKKEYLPEPQNNIEMIRPIELGLEEKSKQPKSTNIKPLESAVCSSCGEEVFDGSTLCPKCEVTDLMLSAERLIASAKGTGIENKHADELVERARTAFKMAKFEEVKTIISELTAITKDTRELSDQLLKYQIRLNELDTKGKDTKELKSQLLLIKSFIQSGNSEKARIYFEKFETALSEFEKKESMQLSQLSIEQGSRCKVCGMKIMSNWQKCPYCNTNVKSISGQTQPEIKSKSSPAQSLSTQIETKFVVCSNCGNELQPDWDICPFCSNPINKPINK